LILHSNNVFVILPGFPTDLDQPPASEKSFSLLCGTWRTSFHDR